MKFYYFIILGIIVLFAIGVSMSTSLVFAENVYVSVPKGASVHGCETANECFIPYEVTVNVGGEVTWSNDDSVSHKVTAGTAKDGPSGIFDSDLLRAGTTFTHKFERVGTYPYFCEFHLWMEGIVFVQEASSEENDQYGDGEPPFPPKNPKTLKASDALISIEMEGPSTFYLDSSDRIVRAIVKIQNYTPSDGQHFMKIAHLESQKVIKESRIDPKNIGNGIWSAKVAYVISDSDLITKDLPLYGEFEIKITAEHSLKTNSTKFFIFETYVEPELIPEGIPKQIPIPETENVPYQKMGFYQNLRYDFSFKAPTNWKYQEGVSIDGENTYEVILYPEEFSLDTADEDSLGLRDLSTAVLGLGFQIDSPLISVDFENVPKSNISVFNEATLEEHALEKIRINYPSAKIIDSVVKTQPWGWEVTVFYNFDFNTGFGSGLPYLGQDTTYFFEDRESYTVSYVAHEKYYDEYRPVYDHVKDTILIKGVVVPEFQGIAMVVLASSTVMIVLFSRKFNVPILNYNVTR